MPVIKREQNITECLNNAVKQQQSIHDATADILRRPASIWFNQKFGSQKGKGKPKRKERLGFDIHSALYEVEEKKSIFYRMKVAFIDYCMDESWINVSRQCSLINMNPRMRFVRLMMAAMSVFVLIYMAPKIDIDYKNEHDHVVFYVDLFVNAGFLVDSINRALSIPMHVRVSKAFGRETNGLDLLFSSGGLRDAPVVILSLAFGLGAPGLWFRLLLLISLTPSFIEAFPHLSILLLSIGGAAGSIALTITLFFLAIIVYASFGHILFGKNDPYHFGSYGLSLWTFFHFAIFDNWMELWNISYHGCAEFPAENIDLSAEVPEIIVTRYGTFETGVCTDSMASPILSTIVFVSFLFLCAYVLMNTSMAAVVIGIKEGLDVYKNMTLFGEEHKITIQEDLVVNSSSCRTAGKKKDDSTSGGRRGSTVSSAPNLNSKMLKMTGGDSTTKSMIIKLEKAWKGETAASKKLEIFGNLYGEWDVPLRWAAEFERLSQQRVFGYTYVVLSILTAVLQVLTEMSYVPEVEVKPVHILLQALFTLEVWVRGFTFHMKPPKKQSNWGWLGFNSLLTMILWGPVFANDHFHYEFLHAFNMLRLVATLQYFTLWIKDLELIMQAFSVSVYGIALLCLLVLVNFLYFVIAGMMLFKQSDPYRFATPASAFSTMVQILTYDSMDNIMRINMLGCNHQGYDTGLPQYDDLCEPGAMGLGWLSPIYFVCFSIMCSIVLMSALIGLIISSMEKLMEIKSAEVEIWKDVEEVAKAYEIPAIAVPVMLSLFEDLDKDGNCHLTFVQLQPMMEVANINDEQEQFTLFIKVDRDGSGQIEFPEFCELLSIMGLILEKTPLAVKKARMAKEMARFKTFDKALDNRSVAMDSDSGIMALAGGASDTGSFNPSRHVSMAAGSTDPSSRASLGSFTPQRNPSMITTMANVANKEGGSNLNPFIPVNDHSTVLKASKTAADRKVLRGVSSEARAVTMRGLENEQMKAITERESLHEGLNASFNPGIAGGGSAYESSQHSTGRGRRDSADADRSNYSANMSANIEEFGNSRHMVSYNSGDESDDPKDSSAKSSAVRVKARRLSAATFTPIEEDEDEGPKSKFFEDVDEIVRSKNIIPVRKRSIFGSRGSSKKSSKKVHPAGEVRGFEMRPGTGNSEESGTQSQFMDDIDSLLRSVERPSRNNSVVVSLAGNTSIGGEHHTSLAAQYGLKIDEAGESESGKGIKTTLPNSTLGTQYASRDECTVEEF